MCFWYLLELPLRGDSKALRSFQYPQHIILWRNDRNHHKIIILYQFENKSRFPPILLILGENLG